jgi:alpha-D-ribose 1-methylphosphonate 5-triphosphate synthase subunit PhnH
VHGPAATALGQARRGTRRVPQAGATLVIATTGPVRPVSLSGPGLPSRTTALLPLDEIAVHGFTAANKASPAGVDVLIATPECLIGLPRSVSMHEVC